MEQLPASYSYYGPSMPELILIIIIAGTFMFFFTRSLTANGIEKIRTFTIYMLVIATLSNLMTLGDGLSVFKTSFADQLHFQDGMYPGISWLAVTLIYIFAIIFLCKRGDAKTILFLWMIVFLRNLSIVIREFYFYLTWKPRIPPPGATDTEMLIMGHVWSNAVHLRNMILPGFLIIISIVVYLKVMSVTKKAQATFFRKHLRH